MDEDIEYSEDKEYVSTREEKLDEDFLFYISFAKTYLENVSSEKGIELCQAWLHKLCGTQYRGLANKRTRNVYLAQLTMAMQGDKMAGPFLKLPPEGPLPPPGSTFGTMPPEEKERGDEWLDQVCDTDLTGDDFNHKSADGRTYLATRALPKGAGAFGYLAVSIGGGDTTWLDAKGQPIKMPEPENITLAKKEGGGHASSAVRSSCSNVKESRKHSVVQTRKSIKERKALTDFYLMLINKVMVEINNLKAERGKEIARRNPQIECMLRNLQKELCIDSGWDLSGFTEANKRIQLLMQLKKKLENKLDEVKTREERLDQLEEHGVEAGSSTTPTYQFVNTSSKMAVDDSMWLAATKDKPQKKNILTLNQKYPEDLVKMLEKLLIRERINIVNRLRARHDKVVAAMKKDLQNEVQMGLDKYKEARKEWQKVTKVIKAVEAAKAEAEEQRNLLCVVMGEEDDEGQAKLTRSIVEDLKRASTKYDTSVHNSELIEAATREVHEHIHLITMSHRDEEAGLKAKQIEQANEICKLKRKIAKQKIAIAERKRQLNE